MTALSVKSFISIIVVVLIDGKGKRGGSRLCAIVSVKSALSAVNVKRGLCSRSTSVDGHFISVKYGKSN